MWEYVNHFAEFNHYINSPVARFQDELYNLPFNMNTFAKMWNIKTPKEAREKIEEQIADLGITQPQNLEEQALSLVGKDIYEKLVKGYTAKQWGVSASEIDPSVLKRVPLRFSYDEGYFDDTYQVMPKVSYVEWFNNILNHNNICVELNVEALERISLDGNNILFDGEKFNGIVIYTGAVDELFDCCYGRLPYRSLQFEWKYEDIESKQKYPVVAYPQAEGYTRITEYKKLPVQDVKGTTYAVEYPLPYKAGESNEPYYPVLTGESQELYAKYKALADKVDNLYLCGRLADFKYYNMDQALDKALELSEQLIRNN